MVHQGKTTKIIGTQRKTLSEVAENLYKRFYFLYKKYRRYTDVVLGRCSSGIRDTTFFSGCIRKSGDSRPYILQEKRKQRDGYDRKQRRDKRTLRHDGFSFLILDAEQGSVRSYGHGSQHDVDVGNGGVNPA